MLIKKVEIQNWRSVKMIEINYEILMIFIGQNNHGKSNLLSALLFFFGEIKHDDLDFNNGSNELYVEITFTALDEFDKNQFKKYLTNNDDIKIRKTAHKSGEFSYNGYLQIPNEDWLKEENISEYLRRDLASALPLYEYIPSEGRITKDLFKNAIQEYISNNSESLEFTYQLETSNFLGLKNVAKGIFGTVFYIPSVKSASEELNLRGNTLFNQLYSVVIQQMSETNQEYKEAKNRIVSIVSSLNKFNENGEENTSRPNELNSFENKLEQELSSWETKIDVEITPPNFDDVFKIGTSVWVDDGIRTDISRKGHGLQRALIIALLKTWANIIKEQNESVRETEEDQNRPARQTSNSSYFIFEEPELYLHPQAQRELFESLCLLTESNNQIMLCTHSSSFIDLDFYKSICIVKKESLDEGTTILQYNEELFSERDDKSNFNLVYWLNPDRSELFFSKKTILVEGPTDKTVLPFLAKKLEVFRFDYTIIDCGGKDAFVPYMELLNKFGLKYIALYDRDHQEYRDTDAITSIDSSSERIENYINSDFGLSIILENDIEEEIGITDRNKKNKPFVALKHITSETFEISESLQQKIEEIYS